MAELWDDAPGDLSDYQLPGYDPPATGEPAQPEETEVAEEAPAANASPERPRDEQGRFAKPEEPELILGKFKSPEDVVKAYTELEQHAGTLRNEVGELRSLVEERLAQPQAPQPQFDLDEMIERSPAHAADMAWRSGNTQALEYTLDQWDEISPGARALWIENKQLQVRLDKVAQDQQPLQQQNEEQARLAVVAQAYSSLSAKYPDFESMRPQMAQVAVELKELTGESVVDSLLNTGKPEAVARALEILYKEARDRDTANLSDVSKQLAQEHAQNSARAREEALVGSVTSTAGEAPKPSLADRIADSWAKADAPYKSSADGWNI